MNDELYHGRLDASLELRCRGHSPRIGEAAPVTYLAERKLEAMYPAP